MQGVRHRSIGFAAAVKANPDDLPRQVLEDCAILATIAHTGSLTVYFLLVHAAPYTT